MAADALSSAALEYGGVNGDFSGMESHIDHIYRAAAAPEHWPVLLEKLYKELEVRTLHLAFRMPGDGDRGALLTLGMDRDFRDSYRTHFYVHDPWMPFLGQLREGEVQPLEKFVSNSKLMGTAFYTDWMRPQGILHGFAALLRKSGRHEPVSSLSGFRGEADGPFRNEDLDRIRPLVPHLQRALDVHQRLQDAELRAGAAQEALDRISGGVILFDEDGAPIVTNRAAERILGMNDGLTLDPTGPRAALDAQTRELQRLLDGAGEGAERGGEIRLARPSGRAALELVVRSIRREPPPLFDRRASAAIFVADPDGHAECSPERLSRICGFTAMEAEVASRIVGGMRLPEIAEDLGITVHTVRGHLKQLFAKTDTHRQVDLVRVLLTGPAGILPD